MSEDLTPFERTVYEIIKKSGELMTTNVPSRMKGTVPRLINKGLVEVYRKPTSPWTLKKRKFLRVKET
ncbi:MAG: hypothetical protein NWF14_03820 [Candidatus Bathyarchaeota archaeon]|nr:hypothetical protein [Candidatus Bathyarchaeota archaeon]